jgi:hypothetical protein
MSDIRNAKDISEVEQMLRFAAEFQAETAPPVDLVERALARRRPRFSWKYPAGLTLSLGAAAAAAALLLMMPREELSVTSVSEKSPKAVAHNTTAAPKRNETLTPPAVLPGSVIRSAVQKSPVRPAVTANSIKRRHPAVKPKTYLVKHTPGTPAWRTETVHHTQEETLSPGIVFEPNPDNSALVARPVVVSAPAEGGLTIRPVRFEHE